MGDYTPKYLYGDQITGTTSAAVTGGQVLIASGDGTLAPCADGSAGNLVVGVAAQDAASGTTVTYFPRGGGKVHVTTTENAVAAGGQVSAGAAGTVDDDGGSSPTFGVFLTTAVAGATAEWMFN